MKAIKNRMYAQTRFFRDPRGVGMRILVEGG
jgi:hypothetical protein